MKTSAMLIRRFIIADIIFFFASTQSFSQEQLGLRLSNYSGINATMFNPAFNVGSALRWDINVISAGAFAENNYIYIKDANLFKVLGNRGGYIQANTVSAEGAQQQGLQYDFSDDDKRREAYTNVFFTGPSAMLQLKKHTLGIFFNVRSVISTNRVPESLGYYRLDALQNGDVIHSEPFKIAGMIWSEIGLNYGRNIFHKKKHILNAGITLKFLQGYEGFYFQNHEPTDITLHDDFMTYTHAHVTYGIASSFTGIGEAATPYDFKARGFGASADVGFIYIIQTKSKKRPYDWKIGLSLLDFGKISFSKDAQTHDIDTDRPFDFVQSEYEDLHDFNDVYRLLSSQSLDNANASYADDHFSIWTPAGISFFAERSITSYFFINAAIVRRLRFSGAVVERDNLWALTPRYESRWFEVSIPVVLYNDKDIRLGTAVRVGPLVVGTDNLTSWFGSQKFSGSDIYVALKLNPLMLQKSKKKSPTNPQDCFVF